MPPPTTSQTGPTLPPAVRMHVTHLSTHPPTHPTLGSAGHARQSIQSATKMANKMVPAMGERRQMMTSRMVGMPCDGALAGVP